MEQLSVQPQAYIRPSPSSGTLGGVAAKTREAMLVCEAAGYDVVIVETVGVGQSETAVAGMTDMFVLLQLPNAGDDLQAIKKGVMELADLVVINKADLDRDAATRAQAQITSALRILGQHGHPGHAQPRRDPVACSGAAAQCARRRGHRPVLAGGHALSATCRRPAAGWPSGGDSSRLAWMWERIESGLRQGIPDNIPEVRALLPEVDRTSGAGHAGGIDRRAATAQGHGCRVRPRHDASLENQNARHPGTTGKEARRCPPRSAASAASRRSTSAASSPRASG
jgi:LAO/AO transport system kinase